MRKFEAVLGQLGAPRGVLPVQTFQEQLFSNFIFIYNIIFVQVALGVFSAQPGMTATATVH